MLTPDTIRAEVKRRIREERGLSEEFSKRSSGTPYGTDPALSKLYSYAVERAETLEELEQWIAGEMAKQAREYARQHYDAELAKLQKGEG